jgi:hypothetical protein
MTGCLFHKPPRAYVPPPIYAAPLKTVPLLDLQPTVVLASVEVPRVLLGDLSLPPWKPAPPQVKPVPPRGGGRAAAVVTPPAPAVPDTPATPAPPKITPLYTPQQTQESTRQLDESLGHVDQILGAAAKKNLNAELLQQVETIKTFRQQAQDMRDKDVMTAVELAKRAETYAVDLNKKLQ